MARVNEGGTNGMYTHDATKVQYSACTVKPVVPQSPKIVYGWMVIMIMIFGHNFLPLKLQTKNAADNILIFYLYLLKKIRLIFHVSPSRGFT